MRMRAARISFKDQHPPGFGRRILHALVLLLVAWLAGFLAFAAAIPPTVRDPQQPVDAIVVLTGGDVRLAEGFALLDKGVAKKMLISGVSSGVDMPALGRTLGFDVPMEESPGLLAHTRPHVRLVDRVLVAPGATLKQLPNGEIVTGVDFGGSPSRDTSPAMGRKLLEGASHFVPRLSETTLDRVTLGFRVLPADGQPIIGRVASRPNVYLAAMHSGITLSPAVGQLAALELLDQVDVEILRPYRLDRFATSR